MQTHVKKISLTVTAFSLSLSALTAQIPSLAPAAPAAPAPAAPIVIMPQAQPASSTEVDTSSKTLMNGLFHEKPSDQSAAQKAAEAIGLFQDKMKALDVLKTPGLDDPEIRARFQTYLSLKEVSDARITEYMGKIAQVSVALKANDTFGAWKILYALSEYPDLDAGISRELANRVEGIWTSNRTQDGLAATNDKLLKDIDTHTHNADEIAKELHYQDLQDQQKKGGGGGGNNNQNSGLASNATNSAMLSPNADPISAEAMEMPTMAGSMQGKMELTDEYLKLLEARARIKLNEIKSDRISDQDKLDFAEYIKMLYDTHRYYHVIIAADFYRALFNESEYPASMLSQVTSALGNVSGGGGSGGGGASPGGGNGGNNANGNNGNGTRSQADMINQLGRRWGGRNLPPGVASQIAASMGMSNPTSQTEGNHPITLSDQVTSALEINERVSNDVDVFKYKASKGDIAQAAEQLQEAFLANEYHPALQGLLRDNKEAVGDFLAKLDVLKNQLEVRDFQLVEGQLADIKKVAQDFDSTKPLALVDGVKMESKLRLGKAQLLAQSGDLTDAMDEFTVAATIWPGNPDVTTSSNLFFHSENTVNQYTTEFDQLVKNQDYRGIFEKAVAYAPAVKGDAVREQQLKDAMTKVQNAEMASEKANMLVMNGDVDGAWETIEAASKDLPDDTKLNKMLANLSGRSADFVSAINKARDAETKKQLGYSLTLFVNAQSYYPASTIANDGIDRISKELLNPVAVGGTSSTSGAN
jgi:thioredoxin-like negative regulator of GroEL